ncbi:VOC family protein [Mycolicibacterium litorale]|uniref:VOC family protein n=1 Tax=Mycolicibacterium litorale TaxID=758802 RepID=UPI003CE9D9DC
MVIRAMDHVAIRVSDIERSSKFYMDAFDARWVLRPFDESGEGLEYALQGHRGAHCRVAFLGFADGGALELLQFTEPNNPTRPVHVTEGAIVHMGFQVEDIDEAVQRVEQAGGSRVWPEVSRLPVGGGEMWVLDPDGNTIQLHDVSFKDLMAGCLGAFPEADPSKAQ